MNQWTSDPTNQWMNAWISEPLNKWTKEPMNQWILPTSSSKTAQICSICLAGLKCKSNSCYSLVHILSVSSAKSVPIPSVFFAIVKCKTISLKYSLVRILPTSPSKIAPICSDTFSFFAISTCKSSSRYSLVHILPTLSSKSVPGVTDFNIWSANRALPTVWCAFFRPPLLRVIWGLQFFFTFEVQIRLLPRSCTLFANLIFQKCSGIVSF